MKNAPKESRGGGSRNVTRFLAPSSLTSRAAEPVFDQPVGSSLHQAYLHQNRNS